MLLYFKNDLSNIFKNYYFYKMLKNDFLLLYYILYIIYYIQFVFIKSFRNYF